MINKWIKNQFNQLKYMIKMHSRKIIKQRQRSLRFIITVLMMNHLDLE